MRESTVVGTLAVVVGCLAFAWVAALIGLVCCAGYYLINAV